MKLGAFLQSAPVDSAAWARARVAALPARWQLRALSRHQRAAQENERAANLALLDLLDRLKRAPLPHDATDADVIDRAEGCADECVSVMALGGDPYERGATYCARFGIEPPPLPDRPPCGPPDARWHRRYFAALARMRCPLWWRRRLRVAQARSVEASAIGLGFVGARGDRYVSDESLRRREQQNRRNAATLESTEAENLDTGQRFTLADLAARSVANKELRRGELITRIKGFESIALDLGHVALFATITCPSRFHPTSGGEWNAKHDGSTPAEAQAYLARTWARIRAQLARDRVPCYGFRIAEPHADACPHWHLLLFVPSNAHALALWAVLRRHALREDGSEAGAKRYRLKCERIDAAKGTATGYVIKYVAKNIDGFRVGDWRIDGDLAGDETLNLSPRVEAWAATWRIRQFAQIGGPPVGLWRELRRVKRESLAEAPDAARDAWLAAQKITEQRAGQGEPIVLQRADFGRFTMAAGGPVMRRKDRPLTLATRPVAELSRYGDDRAPRPAGIFARAQRIVHVGGIVGSYAAGLLSKLIESVRAAWRIVRGGVQAARSDAPRTRVNNCTDSTAAGGPPPVDNSPPAAAEAPPDPDTFRSWAY